jgi:hypothetical protein
VVVHWDALAGGARGRYERALAQALPGVAPVYADARLSAYRVPRVPMRPLAFFGPGWHQEERDGQRRWRWMQDAGEIVLVNPGDAPRAVALLLAAQSAGDARVAALELDGASLGAWQVGATVTARTLRLLVPPGEHRLTLHAPAAAAPGDPRVLSIVLVAADVRWGP